ncbi:XRE family transcriptional regulator [Frondihabitans sucicola]|uniref:XRE family transcriptional regulator n=1 Tax=Frondihabitans sucicola TaxID=1268041 RepID=A0ABM8GTV7_9MICO|nr:XRE family transcriptional regulator [Frondihabitans sucicola]BDZ51911.1 XRE family transcriptional regulator [Frondihabitans sucicola]
MTDVDALTASLAAALADARLAHDLSVSALAECSGVSRAMIGKIERGDVQPTAALLGRLTAALGMTLSELIARAEGQSASGRISTRADQSVSQDPETGYRRRAVSPGAGGAIELVEVDLPAGVRIAYPADSYAFTHHQIWVLEGSLRFDEGDVTHRLEAGDCLQLGAPAPCAYENETAAPCRYLVALARRGA